MNNMKVKQLSIFLQNKKGTEGWGTSSFFNTLSRNLQPIVRECELYGIGRMKLI